MSTTRMLISIYAALFAVAVIARIVAGPLPDMTGTGAGLYAMGKVPPQPDIRAGDVQMAVSDALPAQ
jgi:hypothetical protein